MTAAERITEINRILGIFNKGCGNTVVPPAPATECEECVDDVLKRIRNVALGFHHDADIAVVEWGEQKDGEVVVTRNPIHMLPDWLQSIYGDI